MQTIDFELGDGHEFVELCNLLKLTGLADSGGAGKALVAAGEVTLDGRPESRKTAKVYAGQVVTCMGAAIRVGREAKMPAKDQE